MKLYIDTSVLVKLYYPEPDSERLENWLVDSPVEILFTPLHNLEMTNAFALKAHRGEITMEDYRAWQRHIYEDKKTGILKSVSPDYTEILLESAKVTDKLSKKAGARSLDIIHVASAVFLRCTSFLSNDLRQLDVAGSLELKILALDTL